jgi:hypothetical protein
VSEILVSGQEAVQPDYNIRVGDRDGVAAVAVADYKVYIRGGEVGDRGDVSGEFGAVPNGLVGTLQ